MLSPNQAKLWLVLFSLSSSFTLVFLLYMVFLYLNINDKTVIFCAMSGILGSIMSLMQRNKHISMNIEDGKIYIFLQAVFVPILGMFSGICLYFLSNSDLAFSFAKTNVFNLITLSVIAGFSERYIPDLFDTINKSG